VAKPGAVAAAIVNAAVAMNNFLITRPPWFPCFSFSLIRRTM
jgi:hypothetical protein